MPDLTRDQWKRQCVRTNTAMVLLCLAVHKAGVATEVSTALRQMAIGEDVTGGNYDELLAAMDKLKHTEGCDA
jgi:hypothetical protein